MQRWYDFLAREIPATERPHKVVLTLPTKYPAHEVGQLCKLGFKPENIIGIEGGDGDAIPTFLKESAKLGIDARPGRLEQIVPKLDRRIDVAFLDFLGPPCLGYDEVIQAMPVNDCCFVGVNIMDRREQQEVTSRSESTHVLQNPDFSQHMLETLMERQLVGGRFEEELRNVTKRHHTDFSELKYKIADATMVRQFGLAVPGRTRNFDSLVDSVASIERARALDLLRRSLVKEMPFFCSAVAFALSVGMCQSGLISRQHLGICHNGIRFFNMQMLLAQPLTIKAERYIYKSQVTTRSPNYLSTFAVLRNPFQDLHPCRHLMEALLPLFQAGIIAYRKTGKVDPFQTISVVRRSREGAVLTRPPLSGKDQIDFRFDDAFVSRIRWDQMAKSLQEFQASSANDLHVDSMPDRIELKAAT
jgi:hypothetical protein